MKIYYDDYAAGAGKTKRAITKAVEFPQKLLFVTERRESFPELYERIIEAARLKNTKPRIQCVHSGTLNRGQSVSTEIEELPSRYAHSKHVIAIITHAALLKSDFSGFAGWQIVIDEVPAFLDFEEKVTHLDRAYFRKYYRLTKVDAEGRWYAVTPTKKGLNLSPADVRADDSHRHLSVFHARVLKSQIHSTRHVLCNLPKWTAMQDRKVKWCWASSFSFEELASFENITVLGNQFRSDIGAKLADFFSEDIEWERLPPPLNVRQFKHRPVHISYFSERAASKSFFSSQDGLGVLRGIGSHLGKVLPSKFIWSANHSEDDDARGQPSPKTLLGLDEKNYLSPKQAGTNQFAHISDAAIIYSAKPSPNLVGLLNATGMDGGLWTRSIEYETILQFVTRTSVRDPDSTEPVNVYVFDEAQAIYLKAYFDGLPNVSTYVSKLELSEPIPLKSKGGRPRVQRTPEEQKRYQADRRRKDRERKRQMRAPLRLFLWLN